MPSRGGWKPSALPVAYHNRRQVEGVPYAYHPTLVGPGGGGRHADLGGAGRRFDREGGQRRGAGRRSGPNGVFVNIGRGSTVDEEALIAALANGTIRAAGLDVFADEPHVPQALIDLPNASLLPHVGSASVHTRNAMADLVVDNLIVVVFRQGAADAGAGDEACRAHRN